MSVGPERRSGEEKRKHPTGNLYGCMCDRLSAPKTEHGTQRSGLDRRGRRKGERRKRIFDSIRIGFKEHSERLIYARSIDRRQRTEEKAR